MISVIIPFKDSAPWLRRCLNSLITQSGDFEFIFVNDRSEDEGASIIYDYQRIDERIRLADNAGTPGVSGARNTGLYLSKGEYITFLDADDEFLPEAYKILTSVLKTDANVYQFNHLRYYTRIDKLVLKYTNDEGLFTLPNMPVHWFGVWNKLFRAEFLRDIRFDESLQYGEDGLFILDCMRKDGRIYHAAKNKTVVKHRFDNVNSLSKIKTLPDIMQHARRYEELLLTDADPKLKQFVCMELSRLWEAKAKDY